MSLFLCPVPAFAGGIADADAGIARLNAGDAAAAVKLFTRAIQSKELTPERLALTYHHRGMAFHKEGQAGRAILDYTTALWNENLPKEFRPRTLNNRGLAFESINDFDSALRDYNLAIRMNPNYAEAYGNRGNVHRRAGRHDDAIADYDMALRNGHPHPKYVFTWQGLSLESLGRRREAMDAYRRALSIDPDFSLAKGHLSKLEERQALDTVLGRRKPNKTAAGPVALSGAATAQTASAEAELNAAPWTPPAAKTPTVVKGQPEADGNNSLLRPAYDDQPKHQAASQAAPAKPVADAPAVSRPAVNVIVPAPLAPRQAAPNKPKVIPVPATASVPAPTPAKIIPAGVPTPVATPEAARTPPNGEGGSDVEFALQLGSFKSEELAVTGWKAVLRVAGISLDGLSRVIEPAEVPEKGRVYRLFAEALPDREAALSLCRTLRDKGSPCIVVRR